MKFDIIREHLLAGLNDVMKAVSSKTTTPILTGIKLEDFSAKKRTKSIAFPRQVAMYLSRELTDFSLPKIGEEFGGRDHTTVIHAHEKISQMVKEDELLQQDIKQIRSTLGK